MTNKIKILIDLNIILDVLQKREPHYADSTTVLAVAEQNLVDASMAAHSWTTLFYLYARDQSVELARLYMTDLIQFLSVAPVDQNTIEQALNLPYQDFEDAVQMIAAVRNGAQYLITRNIKDFKSGPIPALLPAELLAILKN